MTFYAQHESPGEDNEPLRRCDARLYEDADHVLVDGIRTMAGTSLTGRRQSRYWSGGS
jgi:hypothetical protein